MSQLFRSCSGKFGPVERHSADAHQWKDSYIEQQNAHPPYFSHVTDIILAEDLYPQRLDGDEPEPIDVVPWSLSQLDELLLREDCTEARSIAALYMARDLLAR